MSNARSFLVIFILGVAFYVAEGSIQKPTLAQEHVANRPDVTVGDTWTYLNHKGLETTLTVAKITDNRIHMQVKSKHRTAESIYDRSWNTVHTVSVAPYPRHQFWKAKKIFEKYRFPLSENSSWKIEAEAESDIRCLTMEGRVKRVTREKVTVAAGTFDAFKIVINNGYQHGCNYNSFGDSVRQYWYAPAAKRVVKYIVEHTWEYGDSTSSGELTKYSIK